MRRIAAWCMPGLFRPGVILLAAMSAASAGDRCARPVILAASAGVRDFVDPKQTLPHVVARPMIGLSVTGGNLADAVGDDAGRLKMLVRSWAGRPGGTMVGTFLDPVLTPDVPRGDYAPVGVRDTPGAHVLAAQQAGFGAFGAELDVTTSRVPPQPGHEMSQRQAQDALTAIADLRRTLHVHTVFPWFTPNDGHYGDFGHDARFAEQRLVALAAGGIALDVPTGVWILSGAPYQATVISTLAWAKANSVRSLFAVSPFGTGPEPAPEQNHGARFLQETRSIAHRLASDGKPPDIWMVQNYAGNETPVNRPGPESDPQSLAAVALWLSAWDCRPTRP